MGVIARGDDPLAGIPRISPDADILLQLESNKPKTTFLVDGKEVARGKRLKVLIDNQGHEVVARPEGYVEKEQYIQPPYSRDPAPRLSFYFLLEDQDPNFHGGYDSPDAHDGGNPPAPGPAIINTSVTTGDKAAGFTKLLAPMHGASQRRVALVIGNAAYETNPLVNPANDAQSMAELLASQGFSVYLAVNANLKQMDHAVEFFGAELAKGPGVGLFYFAGHGVQVDGENYLLPLHHGINVESDVKYKAVNVSSVLDRMGQARNGLNIVILDACRDNPLPKSWSRSATRGLSRISSSPRGTFIAYATEPGNVAQDGAEGHGLFTKHLMDAMKAPRRELELVFKDVLRGVKAESKGKQVPWTSSSFDGEFAFQE